jgi:hypothetical protein
MPIKSFEQVMTEEFQRKQQLAAQTQARRAELDYFAQIEAQRQAEQDARNHERELLVRRIEYGREHREIDRSAVPSLDGIYQAARVEEQLAEQQAEAARRAAITPRQVWMSTLNWQDRQRVLAWEGINKQPYPVPGLE